MAVKRAVLTPYYLEKGPCAGDREIRMRPLPILGQTRPHREAKGHV